MLRRVVSCVNLGGRLMRVLVDAPPRMLEAREGKRGDADGAGADPGRAKGGSEATWLLCSRTAGLLLVAAVCAASVLSSAVEALPALISFGARAVVVAGV